MPKFWNLFQMCESRELLRTSTWAMRGLELAEFPRGWVVAFSADKIIPGPCAGIQQITALLCFLDRPGDKCPGP